MIRKQCRACNWAVLEEPQLARIPFQLAHDPASRVLKKIIRLAEMANKR